MSTEIDLSKKQLLHREFAELAAKSPAVAANVPGIADPTKVSPEEIMTGIRKMLATEGTVRSLYSLRGSDAISIANLLDCAMSLLDVDIELDDKLRKTAFHVLRRLCAESECLPASFYIPSSQMQRVGEEPVGHGSFGIVYRGLYGSQDVAIKLLQKSTVAKGLYKEAVVWKYLSHPNIVPFLGVEDRGLYLGLISEWMPRGHLHNHIQAHPDAERLPLIMDVAYGLQYLHSFGIVHGDLKGINVLVDVEGHARLADFGISRIVYATDSVNAMTAVTPGQGTVYWMAPEVLDPEQYGINEKEDPMPESDIYSLAMLMWEIFTGHRPFADARTSAAVTFRILSGKRPPRTPAATARGISDSLWELMKQCWDEDRHKRPNMTTVIKELQRALAQHAP